MGRLSPYYAYEQTLLDLLRDRPTQADCSRQLEKAHERRIDALRNPVGGYDLDPAGDARMEILALLDYLTLEPMLRDKSLFSEFVTRQVGKATI